MWIATRGKEWLPFEDHSFLCVALLQVSQKCPLGLVRISGWIKMPPEKERKNRKVEKNE